MPVANEILDKNNIDFWGDFVPKSSELYDFMNVCEHLRPDGMDIWYDRLSYSDAVLFFLKNFEPKNPIGISEKLIPSLNNTFTLEPDPCVKETLHAIGRELECLHFGINVRPIPLSTWEHDLSEHLDPHHPHSADYAVLPTPGFEGNKLVHLLPALVYGNEYQYKFDWVPGGSDRVRRYTWPDVSRVMPTLFNDPENPQSLKSARDLLAFFEKFKVREDSKFRPELDAVIEAVQKNAQLYTKSNNKECATVLKKLTAVFATDYPSSMPENTQNKMLSKTIAVIGGAAILLTSAITILQTRKSVSVKTPTAVKTLHTPETTATASTTHAKIQKLLNDGTFDQMPIVAGHHIKEELTKALEQGNERLVTGRLADAGYAIFNGDGRTPQTRQTGALLYTLAAQNATEHDLHNPTSESAQRSVKWLRTTKYGQALNAE